MTPTPEDRLRFVDETIAKAKVEAAFFTSRRLFIVSIIAGLLMLTILGLLVTSNIRLTRAVSDRNEAITQVHLLLDRVNEQEVRAQCFFDLIAEQFLIIDRETRQQIVRDYINGERCPRIHDAQN